MKRIILTFGIISGLVTTAYLVATAILTSFNCDFKYGMIIGYAGMLLAFSFVFVAVRNFREKYNNGVVSFGQAFKIGLLITLITSTFYVVTWLIEYHFFVPDFMDKYAEHVISDAKASGKTPAEIDMQIKEMDSMKEMYKNPLVVILFTYLEILPVGLLISLICALILKRKPKKQIPAQL